MKICIVGKYPPIEGGVSMRTYWTAHGLAASGHEVHVVTNAKEVRAPFRMHMRAQDWAHCQPEFSTGSLTVHWTDPVDRSQSHIPLSDAPVSKLATLVAVANAPRRFDVIFSHYLEPYGIAGHLAAQITGAPHVVRMAGSDAGRLWHHPQFEALYDHVLKSAAAVVATGAVADRAVRRGVEPGRIVPGGGYALPQDLFTPDGPALDLAALRAEVGADPTLRDMMWGGFAGDAPCIGIYGKLGARKGSFALLAALGRLKQAGVQFGLLAAAHGNAEIEHEFRTHAAELGLADRILQIPFLPHWRIPEFLRRCFAVCCLEQNFPIHFHSPIVAREVLSCGTCLVASTEVIKKLPDWERLPHGYGCVAIENADDVAALTLQLGAMLRDPSLAAAVGARGRRFALALEPGFDFPRRIEAVLAAAARRRRLTKATNSGHEASAARDGFAITRLATAALEGADGGAKAPRRAATPQRPIDLVLARKILNRLEAAMRRGARQWRSLAQGVQLEIAVAAAQHAADNEIKRKRLDPLFRLHSERWALRDGDLAELVPVRHPDMRILDFEFDLAPLQDVRTLRQLPAALRRRPSHLAVFARGDHGRRDPLRVDPFTAHVLDLCDGSRTAAQIVAAVNNTGDQAAVERDLAWIEELFAFGLIQLRNKLQSGRRRTAAAAPRTIAPRATFAHGS